MKNLYGACPHCKKERVYTEFDLGLLVIVHAGASFSLGEISAVNSDFVTVLLRNGHKVIVPHALVEAAEGV